MQKRILGIYREKIYSNHAIEADRAIIDEAMDRLQEMLGTQANIQRVEPSQAVEMTIDHDLVLSMAQGFDILNHLEQATANNGIRVINSVKAIRNCYRLALNTLLGENTEGVLYPDTEMLSTSKRLEKLPFEMKKGAWLKRGDFHALSDEDVMFVADLDHLNTVLAKFKSRGIESVVLQKHIQGPIFKFYGVRGLFFKPRYMGIALKEKEQLSASTPYDNAVDFDTIRRLADKAAQKLDLEIYGGDCIIDDDGGIYFIDMNDWPSFRTCRQEAGQAMAIYARECIKLEEQDGVECRL